MIVFLDTGILGLICSPKNDGEAGECKAWLYKLLAKSVYVVTSDLCDYEVRRGLLLAASKNPKLSGLENLETLQEIIDFLPLTKPAMKRAAQLWADSRIQGKLTAAAENIDADIIIAAQYQLLKEEYPGRYLAIATTNVKHLSQFADAREWRSI